MPGATEGEYRDETGAGHGTIQIGTAEIPNSSAINLSLIKFHEDSVLTYVKANGTDINVDEFHHLGGAAGQTYKAGSILKPRKDLGYKFWSGVNLLSGSAEGVLTDKKK